MLARFHVLLPYRFSIPYLDKLNLVEFQHGEYKVKIYPPISANVDYSITDVTSESPFFDAISNLEPQTIITPTSAIEINEQETIQANLLQIDLLADRDFDRRRESQIVDPPLELFLQLANSVIRRLRMVGRLSSVKVLDSITDAAWKIEYLTDDGQPLPKDYAFRRAYFQPKVKYQISAVTAAIWNLAHTLPVDYAPPIWDTLLLDAWARLPDVNTSIVLANAALETYINLSLDALAEKSSIPGESWDWIITRDQDWLKQPSAKEKYDQVLYLLTGRSLKKEEKELWKAFDELRVARNSMVHQGKAVIKKKTKKKAIEKDVTPRLAKEMLANANKIIYWVESILPEEMRRLIYRGEVRRRLNITMTGSESIETELWGIGGDIDDFDFTIKS